MYKHNSKLYKILNIFAYPAFWQPTLFIYLTITKSLPAAQALLLTSIYSLAVVFLEVPGGAVADHYGRKFAAAMGFIIKGFGFLALTFTNSYPFLIAFMILAAYGESLTSGSMESLMYDTVNQHSSENKREFKKLFSQTRSVLHFFMAAYMAIGGYIGKFNLALPLQIAFVFYLIAAFVSLQFIEPPQDNQDKKYSDHIKEGFSLIFSREGYRKGISSLFIADFFFLGLISAMFWLTSPLLDNIGLSVTTIGLITASSRLLKSLSSYVMSKIDDKNDLRSMIVSGFVMLLLFIAPVIYYSPIVVIGTVLGFYIIQGLYQANDIQLLNDQIGTTNRTTVNSIQNMFTRFYEFSVIPIIGIFIDKGQTNIGLLVICTLLIAGLTILYSNRKKLSPEYYH